MRKHRLAECLLADVIGLDWHLVHDEACHTADHSYYRLPVRLTRALTAARTSGRT
jgi:DtxR family transcriptional regulator, iron-dependent repressor